MKLKNKSTAKILRISNLLENEYGKQKPWKMPPLDTLINVILSQNTNDLNSEKAFKKLKQKYPNWEKLISSNEGEIADAIKEGGLANIKAKRIKKALNQIKEKEGKLSLDFLINYTSENARNYLMQIDGIGPKSAAVIVAFAFEKPAFPIDTHIFRVLRRIPIIPSKMSYENAHLFMEEIVPDELKIPLHVQIITHGRKICKAQKPLCEKCIIRSECKRIGVNKK